MNHSKIEYANYTLNIFVGCHGVGCAVTKACWAKGQAKRKKHVCTNCYTFTPHVHPERYPEALDCKKPSVICLNFMAETFEPEFKPYLKTLLVMCNRACWHWFIILTKQPQNIPKDLVFPSNVIVGVSVNCKNDLWRIAELKKVQCVIRMVSFEPLYEDLAPIVDLSGIQWIVIGAQKRPSIQPKTEWVKNLEYAAESRFIPVFLKDNLSEFTWMKCRNCPPKVYQTKYFHQPAVEPEVRFPASKEVALFE